MHLTPREQDKLLIFTASELARRRPPVSAVILGIALANLPFGMLADRFPVQRLILAGGAVVAACGFFCAATASLPLLVGARFVQGLFVPALTTCLAAYLSTNLPLERLNVAMGSYVSATVAGGLGGRLLGGWIHPPLHWRYAFVTASLLVVAATLAAVRWLPAGKLPEESEPKAEGFLALVAQPGLRRAFQVAFGGFFVFSSIFNYLPFYLHRPPFNASTEFITLLYLSMTLKKPLLIEGHAGVGKTEIAKVMSRMLHTPPSRCRRRWPRPAARRSRSCR